MASFILSGTSTVARTLLSVESGVITQSGALVVGGDAAISASGSVIVSIFGSVATTSFGTPYNCVDFDGSSMRLTVGQNGTLASDGSCLDLQSNSRILVHNHGAISSSRNGVTALNTDGDATIEIHNTGQISGGDNGLLLDSGDSLMDVINTGSIIGVDSGIFISDFDDENPDLRLSNTGEIIGTRDAAIDCGSGDDRIVNSGTIQGDVHLDTGNDSYNGRGGHVVGRVNGNDGSDTLRGGELADDMHGGAMQDTLAGRAGDDTLRGADGGDVLRGGRGADTIIGGRGGDTIKGGRDDDMLTGGAGADIFYFFAQSGSDVITDFQNGTDLIDISAFGLRAADYNSTVAPALSNAGGGATLLDLSQLGGVGSLLIEGLGFGEADPSDFIF